MEFYRQYISARDKNLGCLNEEERWKAMGEAKGIYNSISELAKKYNMWLKDIYHFW